MVISKLDLTLFSPHHKGVGFRGDYEEVQYLIDTGFFDEL